MWGSLSPADLRKPAISEMPRLGRSAASGNEKLRIPENEGASSRMERIVGPNSGIARVESGPSKGL
ncbi:protein of unknown function [Kyrpidia spormannii]|uniref:Uncharacterized protein n=1 Tax=Kyrpidia spormannii TaxID=2055160 RepID=A0ACA8Z9J9_9BACL|nr:protein of unknown function [Kyrpidia spormannii]